MSERHSSQRAALPPRESSVTRARFDIPNVPAGELGNSDTDATVISSRPLSGGSSVGRLLPSLEIGRMLEGERLGQFELRQFVGGGGMGVVFRAWDTTLSREVAVKVLSREQSNDEETLRRFRNEAQSAARLDHTNIARVYYVGEDRGVHFIVFEFIEGVNLRDLVDRRGSLPVDEAVDYTLQIARALDHACQRDVIHRDIKPSNVLITADGQAKLVDMGLARLHQVEHPDNDLTASGVTLGTFDYISPEQARDPRSADVRSDLYSLGCSLYFMLVGKPPFPHGTVLQKLLQHQGDEPPDPRLIRPDLPSDLVRILRKLLAKNPQQRYQTPAELIWELSALGDRLATGQTAAVAAPPGRQWTISPRAAKVLSFVLPIMLLVAITWALDLVWSQPSGITSQSLLAPDKPAIVPAITNPGKAVAPADLRESTLPKTPPRENLEPSSVSANDTSTTASDPPKPADRQPSSAKVNGTVQVATSGALTGELPTTESAAGSTSKPKVTANMQPPLVVGNPGDGAAYESLEAACLAAQPGDIIELQFNGRIAERPLKLTTTKLTLRAAAGYRPIVRFVPALEVINPSVAMVQVASGSLAASGIEFELEAPADGGGQRWSLFQLSGASQLQLTQTTLTVLGSGNPASFRQAKVSFVEVVSAEQTSLPLPPKDQPTSTSEEYPTLELTDVLARGNATFLRVTPGLSARLVWNNGQLCTSERLIEAGGPGNQGDRVRLELDLRHLTAETRGGLALLDFSAADATPMLAEFKVSGCILSVGALAPLIDYITPQREGRGDTGLRWRGDRNFYEGVDVFWRLRDAGTTGFVQQLTFSEWQAYWTAARETLPSANAVVWRQPLVQDRPAHLAVPADIALAEDAPSNSARNGASDGLDAGALLDRLPLNDIGTESDVDQD